ncbi:exo-alpha-sialidase [Candidatus Poribacteria bacterium]|nr:exo-alpha-sialidase [Candidatus Poribacteria bacterium]
MNISRRIFLKGATVIAVNTFLNPIKVFSSEGKWDMSDKFGYKTELKSIISGFDKVTCWVHARAGAIPPDTEGENPVVILTMQKLLLSGSDVFYALNEMRSEDMGETWSGPVEHSGLGRREEPDGVQACICDFTPKWHAKTRKLLGTGHIARYRNNSLIHEPRRRDTAYSVYDKDNQTWTPWKILKMPDDEKFFSSGAGSTQRVDLEDSTILLPVYFHAPQKGDPVNSATVVRCSFDGEKLTYLDHGDELIVEEPRGLCEPSLAVHKGRFFLTMRNDVKGYVSVGDDGLHFSSPKPWTFDDGSELGNYNTQQHWASHSDGLFLLYTRRGADNDHVFRHRAPLFMARVDTEKLCVIRDTERIIIPERGARLGNFGVMELNQQQTWVIDAEWMQPVGCEKYGSDNSVFIAKILWNKPNLQVMKY